MTKGEPPQEVGVSAIDVANDGGRAAQMGPDEPYRLLQKWDFKKSDPTLDWLTQEKPEMERWRDLAHRWLSRVAHYHGAEVKASGGNQWKQSTGRVIANKIKSLRSFLVDYLQDERHPERRAFVTDPDALLRADSHAVDDFWEQCCLPLMPEGKDREKAEAPSTRSKDIHSFLTWVIDTEHPAADVNGKSIGTATYRCPFHPRTSQGLPVGRMRKANDMDLSWVTWECPHLEAWRVLAARWIKQEKHGIHIRLAALIKFIGTYLAEGQFVDHRIAADPLVFLLKRSRVPDNLKFIPTSESAKVNDRIVSFLDWVLLHECSETDDYGHPVLSSEHRNPFTKASRSDTPETGESVRSPLPYGYIDDLRRMLVQGPNFRDWSWAQGVLASDNTPTGWFPVDEHMIDKNDPDCVWRVRTASRIMAHEIWSPVRWVALLMKLILPLRTMQVRVLDSGEADTWSYDGSLTTPAQHISPWKPNQTNPELRQTVAYAWAAKQPGHRIASTSDMKQKKPSEYARGVLRRKVEFVTERTGPELRETTLLHINTNKTADRQKEGAAKGFDIPWPVMPWPHAHGDESTCGVTGGQAKTPRDRYREQGELARNIHYWLQKLRNWQTKYNPITRTTSWEELVTAGIVHAKSDEQIEAYNNAVFLFREPAYRGVRGKTKSEAHLPLTDQAIALAWWVMLRDFQDLLALRGQTAPDGSPVSLVTSKQKVSFFPLHSLRVSLITALALEGGMSLPLLQKVVGHSRLLMTLYYTKPSAAHIMQEIDRAHARLSAQEEQSIQKFLVSASIEQLRDQAVFNDEDSAFAALGKESTTRNPAGWMPMHHGVCPMGGNTDAVPENKRVGGCHNGGILLSNSGGGEKVCGPVPGGPRNCVRCRWFITEPRYVPALVVHCNNLSYRFERAQTLAIKRSEELEQLKDRIYDAEKTDADKAGTLHAELMGAERRAESTLKDLEDVAQSMTACYSLIQRCLAITRERKKNGADNGNGMALVANGGDAEWDVVVEGTDSELLQLSGVLDDAEIYPDMSPGEAIIRRSQLLDSALSRDGIKPRFFTLSLEDQHLLGNEFIRRIGHECDPNDSPLGRRMAVAMLENPSVGVSSQLGKSKQYVADLIPVPGEPRRVFPLRLANEPVKTNSEYSGAQP